MKISFDKVRYHPKEWVFTALKSDLKEEPDDKVFLGDIIFVLKETVFSIPENRTTCWKYRTQFYSQHRLFIYNE